jgi:hypothetical protein
VAEVLQSASHVVANVFHGEEYRYALTGASFDGQAVAFEFTRDGIPVVVPWNIPGVRSGLMYSGIDVPDGRLAGVSFDGKNVRYTFG